MILERDFSYEAAESRKLIVGWLLSFSQVVAVVILLAALGALTASIKAFTRDSRVYAVRPSGTFYEVRHFGSEAEAAAWAAKADPMPNQRSGHGRRAGAAVGVNQ